VGLVGNEEGGKDELKYISTHIFWDKNLNLVIMCLVLYIH
jgi:hypothetical protein